MLQSIEGVLKGSDLRRRLLVTALAFAIFRLGIFIPTPGVNPAVIQQLVKSGAVFGLLNLFSGGALSTFSVLAMGIMPYINASIILQLLTAVVPQIEELSKEGAEGQKKITQYTRYGTLLLGFIQAAGVTFGLSHSQINGVPALYHPGIGSDLLIIITLTAGTVFLMWLGEMVNEQGVGNGISLIIFAGIVARIPDGVKGVISLLSVGGISVLNVLLLLVIGAAIIALVVLVTEGERRIPVQYAKRVVGRRLYGGQSSYIPIKVNAAGVIPVIFAVSILAFPMTVAQFWPTGPFHTITSYLNFGSPIGLVLEFSLVVAFTFFYTSVVFKPDDVADNMKKYGGFVPGLRPGKPTAQYLERSSSRVTVVGAIFLGFVAVLPALIMKVTGVPNVYFGGTALLIVVGVGLETMKQIQAQLLMRHYQGFLR